MQINFISSGDTQVALIVSDDIIMRTAEEAAELLMNCHYQGADSLIVHSYNLPEAFFDLKTKLAGDILQKFSTYQGRLAIVGDFSKYDSQSLRDFIYESNKGKRINFVTSIEEAISALMK